MKADPRRREHVVNKGAFPVAPVTWKLLELEANHLIVGVEHGVHVGVEALEGIYCLEIKLYFDLVIGISANNKVDIVPVR